jgi:hypothetical protein
MPVPAMRAAVRSNASAIRELVQHDPREQEVVDHEVPATLGVEAENLIDERCRTDGTGRERDPDVCRAALGDGAHERGHPEPSHQHQECEGLGLDERPEAEAGQQQERNLPAGRADAVVQRIQTREQHHQGRRPRAEVQHFHRLAPGSSSATAASRTST